MLTLVTLRRYRGSGGFLSHCPSSPDLPGDITSWAAAPSCWSRSSA